MRDLEDSLANTVLAPYIVKSMALIGVKRRSGSNMFRHQISTMGILLDYKIVDPVLLKASVIHDLFEDAATMPGVTEDEIRRIDSDGPAVYELVMEVTIKGVTGIKEPKAADLLLIMRSVTNQARVLKLADRISNIFALGFVHDVAFVKKYLSETLTYILPYGEIVNADMFRELSDLVENREQMVRLMFPDVTR